MAQSTSKRGCFISSKLIGRRCLISQPVCSNSPLWSALSRELLSTSRGRQDDTRVMLSGERRELEGAPQHARFPVEEAALSGNLRLSTTGGHCLSYLSGNRVLPQDAQKPGRGRCACPGPAVCEGDCSTFQPGYGRQRTRESSREFALSDGGGYWPAFSPLTTIVEQVGPPSLSLSLFRTATMSSITPRITPDSEP